MRPLDPAASASARRLYKHPIDHLQKRRVRSSFLAVAVKVNDGTGRDKLSFPQRRKRNDAGMLMSRTNTCGCQKSSILSASTPHKANRVSSQSIAKDAAYASAFARLSSTTRARAEFPFSGICRLLKSTGGSENGMFRMAALARADILSMQRA
jgi:hypothetical protein